MTTRVTYFADVVLPLAVPNLYTYRIPMELNDQVIPGQRVVVQFGRNKRYSGLVRTVHETAPKEYQAKYIESLLDERPIITPQQFKFWEWISRYYMCYPGEVMLAALPGALKLASETRIVLNRLEDFDPNNLTDKEYLIYEALRAQEVLSLHDVADILDQKTVYPLIKKLIEKRAVVLEEEIKEQYRPKVAAFVRLTEEANDEDTLKQFFDQLERAPKQLELLMTFIQLNQRYTDAPQEVKKVKLQKASGTTSSVVNELVKKGVFEMYEKEIGRLNAIGGEELSDIGFSEDQQEALEKLNNIYETKEVALLHGGNRIG